MRTTSDMSGFRDEAIVGRVRRLLNDGMLALLAGLGSRAGWLDALAAVQPAPGHVVARAARADEARVRSWLAALVAGRLVEYDGARGTFTMAPELSSFLGGEQGRAYRRRLGELVELAASLPRDAHVTDSPPPAELLALAAGLAGRVARGAALLVLGRGADVLGRELAASFPATRLTIATRGGVPRGRFDAALSIDDRGVDARRAARLRDALVEGGVAVLAVPALTGSPSDDALHPVGAFLLGARALAAVDRREPEPPLPARLAAAGLEVSALARVPSDPFRDYLVVHKPDSRNQ
jgi:hypothetical protein